MTETAGVNGRLLIRIDERTTRMETKEDERWELACQRFQDHEVRLRGLERGWWKPIAAGLSGVAAGIWAWIAGSS